MCISCCTLLIESIAPPREAFEARLNDTVIAGNCPWWLMESGSVVFSNCIRAESGTALLLPAELATPVELVPTVGCEEALFESAEVGGRSVAADGVYSTEVVVAFEPAAADPDDANEEAAPAPVTPVDAPFWI